mmetsp:Transcript_692/g.2298  ORF Transcript_692/g.2298 Transcript_692/m.2298 type:complete len:129 (+) Transcript_692:53-439(+)
MKVALECSNLKSEWILVDLQGDVDVGVENEGGRGLQKVFNRRNGVLIGSMELLNDGNQARLVIGGYELEGHLEKMPRALGLLAFDASSKVWKLRGKVAKKLRFCDRPKLLVDKFKGGKFRKINYSKIK